MSSSSVSLYFDWNKLPEDIFGFIMVKIGLESLDNLHKCRKVFKSSDTLFFS